MKFGNLICFVVLICSCNKYLDKPVDATERVMSSVDDAFMLIDNPVNCGLINIGSDEYFVTSDLLIKMDDRNRQYYSQWAPNVNGLYINNNYWQQPYNAVFNANVAIETLSDAEVNTANQQKFNYTKGAAYFQRAFAFCTIAWQFAKAYNESTAGKEPGIVLDLKADAFESLQRSTIEETYKQIIADIEESLKYLPLNSDHPTRPSKLAAYGLMARVYLSMRKYDKVLEYCNEYLSKQSALLDYNNTADFDYDNNFPMFRQRYGKEVIYYRLATEPVGGLGRVTNFCVDSSLVGSYSSDDLRKQAWLKPLGNYYSFNGSVAGASNMTGICTDEIFLMRAECYARANEVQKAMNDLNTLLVTRWKTGTYIPYTANSWEEALEIVLVERKKELLLRGLRWMDIKRFNEEGANISLVRKVGDQLFILPPNDPRFAMQLPEVIVTNFGYVQNPLE